MATVYAASIEEELTCSVCFELFVDPHTPKDLRCPHVICELCLNRLVKDSAIDCPLCHKITRVPIDGVAALRTNLGMRNLAVTHQKHLDKKKRQSHLSSTSRHDETVPVCSVHDDEQVHLYCITCDVLACRVCVLLDHDGPEHQTKDVKTVCDEHVKNMDTVMNRLSYEAALCEKKSEALCETGQAIMSSIKKEVDEVDKTVEFVVANAYKKGNALKNELEKLLDIKLKDCNRQKLTLQKQAHDLRRAVTETKSIVRDTSSHNFVILHKALTERLNALEGQSRNKELVQYTPGELTFKRAGNLSVKLGELVQVGRQTSVQQVVRKKNTKDKILKIDVSAELPHHFCNIVHNISLNKTGNILVASNGQNKVCIFRKQEDGSFQQTFLNLSDYTEHTHVTRAPDDRFLIYKGQYIHAYSATGKNLRELHRIGLPDNLNNKKAKSSTKFTTTDDGRIVLAYNYVPSTPILRLLTPDGKLIKTISTSNSRINPECITAINNTHVAITDLDGKVGVFDLESDDEYSIFRISSPRSGSISRPLVRPRRPICYDKKTDCLLIGNQTNDGSGVIEQYSLPTGRLVGCVAQWKDGVPLAIVLSGDGSKLAVAINSKVILYNALV